MRQRITRYLATNIRLGSNIEKLPRIRSGEICNRHHMSFLPEPLVGKTRYIRHVNSTAHDAAAFFHRLERNRYERTDRCKNYRGVERLWWQIIRGACPGGTERESKLLRRFIARSRECEDTPALPFC